MYRYRYLVLLDCVGRPFELHLVRGKYPFKIGALSSRDFWYGMNKDFGRVDGGVLVSVLNNVIVLVRVPGSVIVQWGSQKPGYYLRWEEVSPLTFSRSPVRMNRNNTLVQDLLRRRRIGWGLACYCTDKGQATVWPSAIFFSIQEDRRSHKISIVSDWNKQLYS